MVVLTRKQKEQVKKMALELDCSQVFYQKSAQEIKNLMKVWKECDKKEKDRMNSYARNKEKTFVKESSQIGGKICFDELSAANKQLDAQCKDRKDALLEKYTQFHQGKIERLREINDICNNMLNKIHAIDRSRIAEIDHQINSIKSLAEDFGVKIAIM